jgi:hypothetical protein
MNTLAKSIQTKLTQAHTKIIGGISEIKEGCKLYVQILDTEPEARGFMLSRGINPDFLDMIENVGRGRIHERLLFLPGPGPERLQRAPLHEQERILNTGVEVVRLVGEEIKVETKPISGLTKFEAEISLDSGGQVPRAKQEEKIKERVINSTFRLAPYSLDGDSLIARSNCRIPFSELERLFKQAKEIHENKLRILESDVKKGQIVKK